MTSADRIARARTRLLLDFPWFGALCMRLRMVPGQDAKSCPTFQVDGSTLEYNPDFMDTLSDAELTGVLAHEVMHCALLHPFRRGARDPETWNRACDLVINPQLINAKLTLPHGALFEPGFDGLSADQAYAKLKAEQPPQPPLSQPQPQPGGKQGKSGRPGDSGAGGAQGASGAPCPTGTVGDAATPG